MGKTETQHIYTFRRTWIQQNYFQLYEDIKASSQEEAQKLIDDEDLDFKNAELYGGEIEKIKSECRGSLTWEPEDPERVQT